MAISDNTPEGIQRSLLFKELRKCKALPLVFVSIDGSPEGAEQRSDDYLLNAAHARMKPQAKSSGASRPHEEHGQSKARCPCPKVKG